MNFLKKISLFWLIIIPLVLPGIIVSAMRCMLRSAVEQEDFFVETVADFNEFRSLSRADGLTVEELFNKLKENGASSVAISEDTLSSLESEGKITVLTSKEIRKLSLDETYEIKLPIGKTDLGGLWVYSEDVSLLDRIYQNLSWKISDKSLTRIDTKLLLINKSGEGFTDKVGLGFSDEYFKMAEKAGLGLVAKVYNYPGLTYESAHKILNSIPEPASISALLFADDEMLGARGQLDKIVDIFKNPSYRIGWVEFDTQEGIKDYLKKLSKNRPFVRVHCITRKEMDYVYSPERATARFVRAAKDRSLKMLYFNCFLRDEKKYISNLTDYNLKFLKDTSNALVNAGFKIASTDEERKNEPLLKVGKLIPAESLVISLSLMLGLLILLKLSFIPKIEGVTTLVFTFASVCLFYLYPEFFQKLALIVGAISYSSIGIMFASSAVENNNYTFIRNTIRFIVLLVLPSIIGGFLIAGLCSNIEYLLKLEQFHGIKLAFIIPLIISAAWSLKKYGKNVFSLLQKPMTVVSVFILAAVAVSLFLYILRSDNTTLLKPTALEDGARTFLENTLVARPRNKEFLVGYPAALLFVLLLMRKEFVLLPLLAVFVQMGQVSVVNTFCHFHTHFLLTLLRVGNGLWLGILIGLVVAFIWRIMQLLRAYGLGKEKKIFLVGYFGFGNAGDELLRQTYTEKAVDKFKDYKFSVLIGNKIPETNEHNVSWVLRRDFSAVIEELIKAEAVVIPGGGIFQSVTSYRSLMYYLLIVKLARTFKTKVILPAQGLGPWRNNSLLALWLHKKLAHELRKAAYVTVRDNNSVERYKEITSLEAYVEETTDLAFLSDSYEKKKLKGKIDFMRIYAVIRSSVTGATKIASELIKLSKDSENIELVPVAFQAGEDSFVWRRAGWKGEIKSVESFDKTFEGADLVVSMRLHGCIIATNQGIPWIGISYDPKVSSFAKACGWEDFCHNPEEANGEFFENCINKMAFDYEKYSKKLNTFSEKMHKCAVKDFEKSCEAITKVVAILLMLFVFNSSASAENSFPGWMDEVEFNRNSSNTEFKGPVDPETGKISSFESKRGKGFKPKLPDFAELRKKATKTETEKEGNFATEKKSNETLQSINDVPELATAASLLKAVNMLASDTAASISIKTEDEEPSEEELRRRRAYRPGRIKSFYLESKETERKNKEEAFK